jgi:hypothetical protein
MNQNPDALKYEGAPIARPFPNALPALVVRALAALDVDLLSDRFQVPRVDATRLAAEMVENEPYRDGATRPLVTRNSADERRCAGCPR